jgi:glycosyltransferase involved in cell wall biosynthesis
MERPYFSIIIPFYNKERTIKACLESLDAQDFPKDNYEIITVNNNSTDGSISIIEIPESERQGGSLRSLLTLTLR